MAVPSWYHAKTSFTGGEWSEDLAGRFDLPQYNMAVRSMVNWLVQPHGGVYTAPGTLMAAPVRHEDGDQVLFPFEFSADQTYAIEMGNAYLRFFTQHARIEANSVTITDVQDDGGGLVRISAVSHGFSDGEYVVISGVLGTHEANGDWVVTASTANEFTLAGSTFTNAYISGGTAKRIYELTAPWLEADVRNVRVAQNADTMFLFHRNYPTYKLTRLTATTFQLARELWQIVPFGDTNESATTLTPGGTTVNSNVQVVASGAVFTADDNGVHYRIANGVVRINTTGVINSTHANGVITKTCVNVATTDWSKGQWSDAQGYPEAGTFHENRLVVGLDQKFSGSRSGQFTNFDMATPEDSSYGFQYDISTKTANLIRWFAADDLLVVGTTGKLFKITGSDNGGITPTSVFARPQANHGSEPRDAVETSSGIVFMQRGGKKLRRVSFSVEADKYIAPDISLLANRLAKEGGGMAQLAYQSEPNETVWVVRNDGVLIAIALLSEQNINAWARRTTNGLFKSVCATKTTGDDDVWVIAQRTINGTTRKFVEYFDPEVQLDCAIKTTFNSAVSNVTSGLHHLEGEEVMIVGDDATYPSQTVIGAALLEPLDPTVTTIHIGLERETPTIELFLPHREFADGTTVGRRIRTTTVTLRVNESRGLTVGNSTNYTRSTEDLMGSAPSEEQTDLTFSPDIGWNETVIITQPLPFRSSILAAVQHVETGD